jgi:TRAP-type C4-dicarboxylate transport system permease small subunit
MRIFMLLADKLNKVMDGVAGTTLVLMMILTVLDVILRFFGKPIPGTYELVSLSAGVVVAAALPRTSWEKAHVNLPILTGTFSKKGQDVCDVATRVMAILLFVIFGYNLLVMGQSLSKSNVGTQTLQVPLSPFAYIMGACCFIVCIILVADIARTVATGGHHE